MYEDATARLEREEIVRQEAETKIAPQDTIPPLEPEGGEPV